MSDDKKNKVEEQLEHSDTAETNQSDIPGTEEEIEENLHKKGSHPFGDHPMGDTSAPFNQAQDPKRRIGQYTDEGMPPQMRK